MSILDQMSEEERNELFQRTRDKWIQVGHNTERANFEETFRGISMVYRDENIDPADVALITLDNPIEGLVAAHMLSKEQYDDYLDISPSGTVARRVRAALGIKDYEGNGGKLTSSEVHEIYDQIYRCSYGSLDADWLGYYDIAKALQIDVSSVDGVVLAAQNGGMFWMFDRACVIIDRPTALKYDEDGAHHCEDGPAIAYNGGYEIYLWHGTRVPADLVNGKWGVSDILAEENAEIRRCGIEKMGWARFIDEGGFSQVGESVPDPGNPGYFLSLYDIPEDVLDVPARILVCDNATPERDGTRRRFGLYVDADTKTPLQAAAELAGLTEVQYAQLQRAC